MRFKNVADVVKWRLCVGCGACMPVCPEGIIKLVNNDNDGIRPSILSNRCGPCNKCLTVCPGLGSPVLSLANDEKYIDSMSEEWGKIKEIWEGYSADEDLRYFGSSGGVASAIALYCLEKEGVKQVIHTGLDHERPWRNRTVFSRKNSELLEHTGSRYAPSSPCDGLSDVIANPTSSVFIGKPCDIHGVRKAEHILPEIRNSIKLRVSIFCAGTPSAAATIKLIDSLGVPINNVTGIRYRGRGWPGTFAVWIDGGEKPEVEIPYATAWGFLQKYRPFRCYLCPDGTGELADISCGDPWYRDIRDGEKGYSLILLRTERGRELFHKAVKEGYIKAEQVKPDVLSTSQPGFRIKKGAVWGRILALRAMGIPAPDYRDWGLFKLWLNIPMKEKAKSIFGTIRRALVRQYFKPQNLLNIS